MSGYYQKSFPGSQDRRRRNHIRQEHFERTIGRSVPTRRRRRKSKRLAKSPYVHVKQVVAAAVLGLL